MAIKLIALDIDGTLVNSKMEVTAATVEALQKAAEQGIRIVLSTGRPEAECGGILERLPCIDYINGCTGARVVERRTGKTVAGAYISAKETRRLYERLRDLELMVCVLDPERGMYHAEAQVLERCIAESLPHISQHLKLYYVPVDDMDAFLGGRKQFVKLYTPCFTRKAMEEVKIRLAAEPYTVLQCGPMDIEICPADTDKGTGLRMLAEVLGLRACEVMAIGDSENDLGMLSYAGLPVVMANGTDEAKTLAKYITDDNDHDGVAKAVNMVLEGTL